LILFNFFNFFLINMLIFFKICLHTLEVKSILVNQ
jgi:hypothetical protein